MKVLVTGGGGFLGAAVARAAAGAGLTVTAIARTSDSARLRALPASVRCVMLDLRDAGATASLLEAERPDVLVHTAWSGLSSATRASVAQIDDNLLPTCRLAAAAVRAGVGKFVGVGSQAEYGSIEGPVDETRLPAPRSMYGATKVAAATLTAEIAREGTMSWAWLRLFATYGPGDNPAWLIPSVMRSMARGERPRTTAGTQAWDYLFVDDAAAAVLAVAQVSHAAGVFNLASGDPVIVREVIETARDIVAPAMPLVFGEVPFAPGQIMHMEGRVERLRDVTGWRPRIGLREGLRRTAEGDGLLRVAA